MLRLVTSSKLFLIWALGFIVTSLIQLSLNITLTGGAYLLAEMKIEYRFLKIQEQIINEKLETLRNPYNLSQAAEELGMIYDNGPLNFISLD